MLKTIKNKIIFFIILLVFIVQVVSAAFQYVQVKSVFFGEFVLGAKNLSQSPLLSLTKRVSRILKSSNDEKGLLESMEVFIQLVQMQQFGIILNSRDDILEIQFLNKHGDLIAKSVKSEEKITHQKKTKTEMLETDELSKDMVGNMIQSVKEDSDQIYIFIPFEVDGVFLGGIVLKYSNQRIVSTQNRILLTTATLLLVFTTISIVFVFFFTNNVLTRPTQQMITMMTKLAHGDFEERFNVRNNDEIGQMGAEVNNLVISLQTAISDINEVMAGVEKGDLSRHIDAHLSGDLDRLKEKINRSISLLSQTISQVSISSRSVENSANELSSAAESLAAITAKQASTLEEISASMIEIEHHAKQNTEDSTLAREISHETSYLLEKGKAQMDDMQTSMDQINSTSVNVTKIIKVIDEIAFQTNLLALNAAVEAARAGKYGKGFAVVAEEVRNLAARSADAAKDTTSLIESSLVVVEKGVENADKTGTILDELVEKIEQSNQLVSKIAESTAKQSSGISEISAGISAVNDNVQQASAISQETASSSDVMFNQSKNLKQEISRFRLQDEPLVIHEHEA